MSPAQHVERVHLVAMPGGVRTVHLHLLVVEDVRRKPHVRRALRQAAEEQHAAPRPRHLHRLLLGDVAGAGDDDDVGSDAVGRLAHGGDAGRPPTCRRTPSGRRRGSSRARSSRPRRVSQQLDVACPLEPGDRAVRRPHRPGADHDHAVVEADADVLVAADRVGQRIGERRVLVGQAVGDPEQVLERDLRDRRPARRRRPGGRSPSARRCTHRCSLPVRHIRQWPHQSVEMQCRWSPTAIRHLGDLRRRGLGPISISSPLISWPSTHGGEIRRSPL